MLETDLIEKELLDIEYSDLFAELPTNKRISLRYVRDDIGIILKTRLVFGLTTMQAAKLENISSKGASVACHKKMEPKEKVTVLLSFKDGKTFEINASIAHRSAKGAPYFYGLKFDRFNHDLGEHLLATQSHFNIC